MKESSRTLIYGLITAGLLLVVLTVPPAWATPRASVLAQTVPTRTPTSAPEVPTNQPPPATEVVPTAPAPTAPGATAAPTGAATRAPAAPAAGSAACAAAARLTLVSDRQAVAPGATVVFTATLANTGRQPLRQIVLEDTLSAGLEPGEVISGGGAWQGRTLRVTSPTLSVGAQLVSVYSVTVAAQPGPAITARASATTAGCPQKTATVTLALPPSELPQTGGGWR